MIRSLRLDSVRRHFWALLSALHSAALLAIGLSVAGCALGLAPTATAQQQSQEIAALKKPAVAAILELDRETPGDQLRVVLTLNDLGHPELAEPILSELTTAKLSDQQLADLVTQFGPARFVRLIRTNAKSPAAEFAQNALEAATKVARDPKRIGGLFKQLRSNSPSERQIARNDLAVTGEPGMKACFAELAEAGAVGAQDEAAKNYRAQLLATLGLMRPAVEQPLLAGLATGRGNFRRDLAELAGHLQLDEALPWLAMLATGSPDGVVAVAARDALLKFNLPLPSPKQAQELVRRDLVRLTQVESPRGTNLPGGLPDPSNWWTWNPQAKSMTVEEVPSAQRRVLASARLAHAYALGGMPASAALRQQLVLLSWEEAAITERPVAEELAPWVDALTTAELSGLLDQALTQNYPHAAIRAAETLAHRADASALQAAAGHVSPLVRALDSTNRTVRFAALQATLKLSPSGTFPGASRVVPALWFFAASAGKPVAVTAASTIALGNDWSGGLRQLGYEVTPTGSGRGALLAAFDRTRTPRLSVVLLDSNLNRPRAREVLYQLRNHPPTFTTPVALLCTSTRLREMEALALTDRNLMVEVRPYGEGAIAGVVERLMLQTQPTGTGHPLADTKVRLSRANFALQAISQLLEQGSLYDELVRDSDLAISTVHEPQLMAASFSVLARLGTRHSQVALASFASNLTLPISARRAAANAFANNVRHAGLQLTRTESYQQFERYNASEAADADTQEVLAHLLNVIEGKPTDPLPEGLPKPTDATAADQGQITEPVPEEEAGEESAFEVVEEPEDDMKERPTETAPKEEAEEEPDEEEPVDDGFFDDFGEL